MPAGNSVKLLGVRIDSVDWPGILEQCQRAIADQAPLQINTINGEIVLTAERDSSYCEVLNEGDLNIADSTNVVWLARLKGQRLSRTPGVDCLVRLCRDASEKGQSVFLLGAKPGVAAQAAAQLQKKFPKLIIAGVSAADPADPAGLKQIQELKPTMLFVAYGAPAQEKWIHGHKHETGAIVHIGVGGSFDMLAGVLPRAPKFFRALSLEWLWRLFLEPKRLGRIWHAVVVFPLKVLFS